MELQVYMDHALKVANKLNVDAMVVRGLSTTNNQIRFSQNKIDINKQWAANLLQIFLAVEGNQVTAGEFSPTSDAMVAERVKSLVKFAKKLNPSPFYHGIEGNETLYNSIHGQDDPRIENFRKLAPEIVNECIAAALEAGAKRVAGSFFFGSKSVTLSSTEGPRGEFSDTFYNLTVRAFQEELDASGQGLACGCSPSQAKTNMISAGERAGRYSKQHKGAVQAKPGIYDVIMTPAVAANLLGSIPDNANPLAVIMGMSPLEDKMGEKLAPDFLTVTDNGRKQDGLGTAPFDFEGTLTQSTPIIENGVLVNFLHNTSTAEMYQTTSTGNSALVDFIGGTKTVAPASTNLVFSNGDKKFEELLENGSRPTLFVTCNWYTRYTSMISTEYSTIPRDAAFLIEDGELATPIKNFRISDNLLRQFSAIDALANDRAQVQWWEVETPTWIPSLRVKDCRITTATQ